MKKKVLIITVSLVLIIAGIVAFALPGMIQGMKAGELRKDPMKYLIYAGAKADFSSPKSVELTVDRFLIPEQLEYFLSSVGLTPEKASEIISNFSLYFATSNLNPDAKGETPMFRYKGLVKYDADDLISFDLTMAKKMLKLDFAPLFNLNMISSFQENAPGSEDFEKSMNLMSKYLDLYKVEKDEIKAVLEDKEIEEVLRKFFDKAKFVGSESVMVGGQKVTADRIDMEFTFQDIYELAIDFVEQMGTNKTLRALAEKKVDQFVDRIIQDKDYELFHIRDEEEAKDLKRKFREQLDEMSQQAAYMRANMAQLSAAINPSVTTSFYIHDNKLKKTDNLIVIDVKDDAYGMSNLFLQFRLVTQDEPSFKLPNKIQKDGATVQVDSMNPELSKEDADKIKKAVVEGLKKNIAFEKIVKTVSEVTGIPVTKEMIIQQLEMQIQMMIENGVNMMNF